MRVFHLPAEGIAITGDLVVCPVRLAGPSQLKAFLFDDYVTGPGVAAAYREVTESRTR